MSLFGPSEPSDFDESLLKDVKTSRDFKLAHPVLVKMVKELFEAYKRGFPHRDIIVTCTYRNPLEQQRLYAQGRFGNPGPIVTHLDGRTKLSNHNKFPARAVDLAILECGKCVWDETPFWPLGALAKQVGLIWGGDWVNFKDYPHLEIRSDVK